MGTWGIIAAVVGLIVCQWGVIIRTRTQYSRGNRHIGIGTSMTVLGAITLSIGVVTFLLSL